MKHILTILWVAFLCAHRTASAEFTYEEIIRCSHPVSMRSYDSYSVLVDAHALYHVCSPHFADGRCSLPGMFVRTAGTLPFSPYFRRRGGALAPGQVELTWDPQSGYIVVDTLRFSQTPGEIEFPMELAATFTQAPSTLVTGENLSHPLLCRHMDQLSDRDRDEVVDMDDPCPDLTPGNHPDPNRRGCPLPE